MSKDKNFPRFGKLDSPSKFCGSLFDIRHSGRRTCEPVGSIIKRNGTPVDYDRERIATAIFKAAASIGGTDRKESERLAGMVESRLESM